MKGKNKNFEYLKIDASYLPKGYSIDKKERYYAEFYPDGQLKAYGFFIKGSKVSTYYLELDRGKEKGKYQEGMIYHRFENGVDDQVNGYFDSGDVEHIQWEDWIKRSIGSIYESAQDDIGIDLNNLFTIEQAALIEKQLFLVKLGMGTAEMEKVVFESIGLSRGPYTIENRSLRDLDYNRYRICEGYIFITICNGAKWKIKEFRLEGNGWLPETREFVKNMPHV